MKLKNKKQKKFSIPVNFLICMNKIKEKQYYVRFHILKILLKKSFF